MDKNTIIFYKDWLVSIENLPMDKQASLVFTLLRHVLMGDPAPDDELSKMFYGFVKSQVLRDTAEDGRRHRGNQYTNWNKMEQNGTNGSDNDNDNDNVDDNDNDNMPTNVGNKEKTSKEVKKKKAKTSKADQKKNNKKACNCGKCDECKKKKNVDDDDSDE